LLAGIQLPNHSVDPASAISNIPQAAKDALAAERPSALALLNQVEAGVPYYLVIPLIVVIVLSFLGLHTMLCLAAGMVSSLLFGMLAGTTNLNTWLQDMLLKGFGDAGSWVIVMMAWVSAFGGIMNSMDAFAPLAQLVVKLSRNVQQLMGWCGILCLAGNMALADEAAQVATMSPIIRDITEKHVQCDNEQTAYTLRLRLSTFSSSMGIYGSQLVPWHCFPVFFSGIAAAVYPLMDFTPIHILQKNYMSMIVVGSLLLLTFTGWDRFIPMFALPNKTHARLRRP
jgi:Na+/H+ antiporter NhaC